MAFLGFSTNGDGPGGGGGTQVVTQELIDKKVDSLENSLQKDFIKKCLRKEPDERPTARELLFHTVLFGVHSLKLLAAHALVTSKAYDSLNLDDFCFKPRNQDPVIAEIKQRGGQGPILLKYSDVEIIEDLDKFVEDVRELSRTGISPQAEPTSLADDLFEHGFICEGDKQLIGNLIRDAMSNHFQQQQTLPNGIVISQ